MNRRQLVAGATVLLGQAHLPLVFASLAKGQANVRSAGAPEATSKNLLSSTYPSSLLSKSLLSASAWHPYARVEERDAWQNVPRDISDAVIQRADKALEGPWESIPAEIFLDFKRNGNRSRFEHFYFIRRQRLTDLVLGECIQAKGRYLDEIVNGIWLTCEETFWGLPAHMFMQKAGLGLPDVIEPIVDLYAAETSASLSWIDYLLGTRLDTVSPLIRPRIRIEAKRRVLDPCLERNDFSWLGLDGKNAHLNNWTPWINANWMTTVLLLEPDVKRRVSALSKMCLSLDRFLADYSPDGACEEGPGYWEVATGSYFDCCTMLESATGGAASVLSYPLIDKMSHYIVDVHIADDYYVNYGDAKAKFRSPPGLSYRMGVAFGDKALEEFGAFYSQAQGADFHIERQTSRAFPDVLEAAAARKAPKADALERDSWYPALGLMTARAKAATTDGFYLAVQTANIHRSHNHNDSGSFIIFHDGKPVFIDVGNEAYTAKTFGPDRDSMWTIQSAYHNLPTINGFMQQGKEKVYRASEVQYSSDDAHAGLSMNLATAYPTEAGIQRWLRDITLDRKTGKIHLTEDFQLKSTVPVMLSFMTPRVPSKSSNGTIMFRAAHGQETDVYLAYDPSLIVPKVEKIDLKDGGLRQNWGDAIYRVLLTSAQPTNGGKWAIEIS
jgi:hypothetical protein